MSDATQEKTFTEPKPDNRRDELILVVDDRAANREAIAEAMERQR